jgi:hypothetical protein
VIFFNLVFLLSSFQVTFTSLKVSDENSRIWIRIPTRYRYGTDGNRKKFTNNVSFLFQIPPYRTYLEQNWSKNRKKNLDSYCFVTSFGLKSLKKWCKCNLKTNKQENYWKFKNYFLMASWRSKTKIAGSGSESIPSTDGNRIP